MLANHDVECDQSTKTGRPSRGGRPLAKRPIPRLLTEEIVHVGRLLDDSDQALIRAVYERGVALKALASIHNCSRGRIHHRLCMLVRRMRSPLFRLALRERESWPADRRTIAETVVLRGRPQREAAEHLGVSLHRVRMELEQLKALAGVREIHGES